MDGTVYSVKLSEIVKELSLKPAFLASNYNQQTIVTSAVNRPSLQLIGFYDYFENTRIQIVGKVEEIWLNTLTPEQKRKSFKGLLEKHIPALVFSHSVQPMPECLEMAKKYDTSVFTTDLGTSTFMADLITSLRVHLAPSIRRHGVLVEVYGEGLLILGDSGIGKSETAVELIKRGHRLIADDAVDIKKVSNTTLVGTAPDIIRHYMELRGIGIVNIRRLFGMGAIKSAQNIDLIVHIEPWKDGVSYDRLGLEQETTKIMDVEVPSLTIPVTPGRNLAVILEVAAMNIRQKKMGYNAALEFSQQLDKYLLENQKDID